MTNFAYIAFIKDKTLNFNNEVMSNEILYVNKLRDVFYKDGEILETDINRPKDITMQNLIFDVFARILVKNAEQRKALYHLMFDKVAYNRNSICKKLSNLYGKSDRTYSRALDYLYSKKLIYNKDGIIEVSVLYDISLLDLDNVKSIIIHIN